MKATLIGLSKKAKRKNTWNNVYVDQYVENGEEYIKVFVTRHDLENRHFNLAGIDFDGESYRIVEKTFEETKRSAYNDEELVLKFANVQDLNKHLKDEFIEYVYLFDEEKNKFIFKHIDDARFKTLTKNSKS